MNLLSKIAINNLKKNKYKSILLTITIVLLTILLTNVGIIYETLQQNYCRLYSNNNGDFQAIYKGLSYENALKVKSSTYLGNVGIGSDYAVLDNKDGSELYLDYLDKTSLDLLYIDLIEGRLPKEKDEIAIEYEYLKYIGDKHKIGDNIEIDYNEEGNGENGKKVFKIVGLLESRAKQSQRINYLGVISSRLIDKGKNNFNTYINIKKNYVLSEYKVRERLVNIAKGIGIDEYTIKINDEYIAYKKYKVRKDLFIFCIVLVILISGASAIYSIFHISTILNIKEFGKLRMLGATNRQIQGILIREVLILLCISICVGLIVGYWCSKIILLNKFNINNIENEFKILFWVVIVTLLVVIISIIMPIKTAKKITPVEVGKFNDKFNRRLGRRGFPTINIKALTYSSIIHIYNMKTYVALGSSLVSGILVVTLSILLLSLNPEDLAQKYVNGDFRILISDVSLKYNDTYFEGTEALRNPLGGDFRQEVENIPGVLNLNLEKTLVAEVRGTNDKVKRQVVKGEFREQLLKENVDYDDLIAENGAIIGSSELANDLGVNVGDNITITFYDGNNKINKEFLVKYICKNESQDIIVPSELINNLEYSDYTTSIVVNIDKNYYDYVKSCLKDIIYNINNVELKDLRVITNICESNYEIIKLLIYLIIIIVSIICAMNNVNIMITSIIIRKRELGVLQAVGLSKRQLVRRIGLESLFYTNLSIGVIFVFSNLFAYIFLWILRYFEIIDLKYKLSFMPALLMGCILLIGDIILYCIIRVHFYRESPIEQLRHNN